MIGNEMHVTFTPQGESIEDEEIQDGEAEGNTEP